MSRANCAASIRKVLMGLCGVRSAHVDFLSGLSHVVIDRHAIQKAEVFSATHGLGYTLQTQRPDHSKESGTILG
jgi:copper chaperone CopZ